MTRTQLSKLDTIQRKLSALMAEIGQESAVEKMQSASKLLSSAYVFASTDRACRGMVDEIDTPSTWVDIALEHQAKIIRGVSEGRRE